MRKVGFYTQRNLASKEYYLGTDNNPFPEDILKDLVEKGTIFQVKEPIELEDDLTLYVDSRGKYYLAYYLNSSEKQRFVCE